MHYTRAVLRHAFMQSFRTSRPSGIVGALRQPVIRTAIISSRTMAFFPRSFYEIDTSPFTPLFRFLDDFDTYTRQIGDHQHSHRSGTGVWQPKFDVRETSESYELHGELPGMNKENVHVEFTEPQTLVVHGKAERSYTAGTPPASLIEQTTTKGAITESVQDGSSHKATVKDESEVKTQEPTPLDAAVEKADKKTFDKGVKYWLSERSIGEFSRTFNFPAPIEQDSISVSFRDSILSITVPKAKKHGSRRIAIH